MFSYSVKVHRLQNPTSSLVGFADLIIEDFLVIKDFKVFEGRNGQFVKAPSKPGGKDEDGNTKYWDTVLFFEDKPEGEFQGPMQTEIYSQILEAFNSADEGQGSGAGRAAAAAAQQNRNAPRKKKRMW